MVRPQIILVASRGAAAIFDSYAVGPARQLRQRKVFRIYAGPDATGDATIASSAGPIAAQRALEDERVTCMERPKQQAAVKVPRPGHDMCGSARDSCSRFAPEAPAGPGSLPSSAALCMGQGLSTTGPKRPFAPRGRRRDDELGPERVFAKAMHSRQILSSADGDASI